MGLPIYTGPSTSTPNQAAAHESAPRDAPPAGAGANTGAGTTRPKTSEEQEADRLYEEAMEEEYAKREGGA
ncbi:hypothetical protein VB005_05284 [Metarhizium brunneum]